MEYRNLGNSELNVSILSLGCLNFGLFCDQETTTEIINTAIDLGVNCIDTAALYGGPKGHCETLVGKAIEGQRDKVILATKFGADSKNQKADEVIDLKEKLFQIQIINQILLPKKDLEKMK